MGIAEQLRNLDGHSTVSKEFRVYTVHGAVVTLFTLLSKCFFVRSSRAVLSKFWFHSQLLRDSLTYNLQMKIYSHYVLGVSRIQVQLPNH